MYMVKPTLIILFSFAISVSAQLTIGNGHHILEITGAATTYFNHRILKADKDDFKKNRFKLRDAQIQLEGRIGNEYEYELQFDLVDLAKSSLEPDPENPGLMDCFIIYKGLKFFDIKLGWSKTPYSRSSLIPFIYSPYWQRPEFLRGDIFARRDVGMTLQGTYWKQRLNLFLGAYTGLGEISLKGNNDNSGKLEYIARIEVAYPSRYKYRSIDNTLSPQPIFVIGLNTRYANKRLNGGGFPAYSTGEYNIKVIDGRRLCYGLDVAGQYNGFSGQFEWHYMYAEPQFINNPLLYGRSTTFFTMNGFSGELSYFLKKSNLILSSRFEQFDLSDLVQGKSQRIYGAIAYQLNDFDSMIKFQYWGILSEESNDPLKWTDQFRIGWCFRFR